MSAVAVFDATELRCDRKGCDASVEHGGSVPPPPWVTLDTRAGVFPFCCERHAMQWRAARRPEVSHET